MMIDTLHGLEKLSFIERREFKARVKRVEYRLSSIYADHIIRLIKDLV